MPQRQPYKSVERRLAGGAALTTDAVASSRMSRVLQRGTEPELLVRKALRANGLRFTTSNRDLPGSPDLANRSRKWAVFVHGCYWHRHAGCSKATTPKTNVDFWMAKFERNRERDTRAVEQLKGLGYRVVVVWECDAKQEASLRAKLRPLVRHSR